MINNLPNFADAAPGGSMGTIGMIAIYVLLFAALYFFLIRPNSKKKKEI